MFQHCSAGLSPEPIQNRNLRLPGFTELVIHPRSGAPGSHRDWGILLQPGWDPGRSGWDLGQDAATGPCTGRDSITPAPRARGTPLRPRPNPPHDDLFVKPICARAHGAWPAAPVAPDCGDAVHVVPCVDICEHQHHEGEAGMRKGKSVVSRHVHAFRLAFEKCKLTAEKVPKDR